MPTQKGHWILYEVVTGTSYSGRQSVINVAIASGDYASGQTVTETLYPNGSYTAVQSGGGLHTSYHYELLDEILTNNLMGGPITTQNTPENIVF